ncbi:MAG: hypothetical protein KC591_11320, partial [Gemmatimonadetes bacterium]|nr:hypothetical protein [Gemmatimonadota bacterium]
MNLARWRTVVGADSRFHATRPLFWILLLLLALLAFGLAGGNVRMQSGDTAIGGDKQVWLTSEFSNALAFGMMGVIPYVFFIGIAAGMAILRDEELNVGPILHSTRLRPSEYVRGKFAAVLLACFTVLLGHVLLAVFFNHVMPTANAENIRGPLSWTNYLRPAFVMIGPLIVFMAGTTFALGTITRNAVLVFVLPLIVFIVCPFLLWEEHLPAWVSPGLEMALRWIDPSGFRWINETWVKVDLGVDYYNLQPVTYDVPFLLSRLAFVAVGLLAAFAAEVHFARTLRGEKAPRERRGFLRGRRVRSAPAATGLAPSAFEGKSLASLSMQSRRPGFLRTVRDVLSVEARALATSPGLYIFAPLIIIEIVSNDLFETGPFEVPMLSTPGTAAVSALGLLTTILCFLLLFYTTESVLRDFHRNLAPISHATPARTGAILLGKALANGIVAAVILAAAAIGNVIIMLVQGKIAPDLGPVLLVWGGLAVPTVILWATFVTFVVALTGSRFATYGIGLGVMFFTAWKNFRGEMNWVGNWSLWSTARWTDFGGLALNESAFLWNRLFWLSIAALLVAFAVKRFPRREFDDARQHARWTPKQLGKGALRLSPFLVPALVLGAGLYVKTTHGFQGSAAERREKEYWGRNYATWADVTTPEIGGVDVSLSLDPAERAFSVRGEYVLVNLSDEPMPRFPMSVGDHFRDISWTLNGEEAKPEHRARLYVFTPDTPLMPGDSLRVGFEHHGAYPDGFTKNGGGMGTFILESGIVLTSFESSFLPLPFFEIGRGIEKDNRMDPRDYPPDYWHGITKPGIGSGARFPVRLTIDSPAEYEVHGVGVRTSDSTEDGRRTVVWEADHPVNFFNVVGSKRWDCRRGDGVEIWHLPEHTYNLDEMVTALEGARRWYSEWFFPYPWQDLRVNEFPGLASYAQGFPTNITFSEAIGFLTRDTDEVDAAFLVTAHEAAHQWW